MKVKGFRTVFCFALVIIIAAAIIPFSSLASGAGKKAEHPYVLVHGLYGWGKDEGINNVIPYWGATTGKLVERLNEDGHEFYEASVGPLSSTWDRACELYAELTGTRVDYGEAHSKEHNHLRYGRTYTQPLFEDWGKKGINGVVKKVNLLGHSFGGPTVRLLAHLLDNGAPEEVKASGKKNVSPLFTGGKAEYVNSVVTICAPHNGCSIYYVATEKKLKNPIMLFTFGWAGLTSRSIINGFFDFHLEQFGLTNIPGQKNSIPFEDAMKAVMNNEKDTAYYGLSPMGSKELNDRIKTSKNVYYLSYYYCTTQEGPITGNSLPFLTTNPILLQFSKWLGEYEDLSKKPYAIDKSWQPNDGLVNVVSAHHPFDEKWQNYDENSIKPGVWNVMPQRWGDHGVPVGLLADKGEVDGLYSEIISIVNSLPQK